MFALKSGILFSQLPAANNFCIMSVSKKWLSIQTRAIDKISYDYFFFVLSAFGGAGTDAIKIRENKKLI